MPSRRDLLSHATRLASLLAATGAWPLAASAQAGTWNAAAFQAHSLADVTKAWGAALPVASTEVSLVAPDIAENGAAVPLSLATTLAGARHLLLLVEKNPAMLSAQFELNDAIEPAFSLRVKMNESSKVYAVALMGDGRAFFAQKDVSVTLGGCADG